MSGFEWRTESPSDYFLRAAIAAVDLDTDIVDDLSKYATKRTKIHTPVSSTNTRTAGRAPGSLKQSIVQAKTKEVHGLTVGGVQSFDDTATHVEYPTGLFGPKHSKYPIRPVNGRTLRFLVQHATKISNKKGERMKSARKQFRHIQVAEVMHPGSKGAHMFLKGIQDTQVAAPRIMERHLKILETELRKTQPNHSGFWMSAIGSERHRVYGNRKGN